MTQPSSGLVRQITTFEAVLKRIHPRDMAPGDREAALELLVQLADLCWPNDPRLPSSPSDEQFRAWLEVGDQVVETLRQPTPLKLHHAAEALRRVAADLDADALRRAAELLPPNPRDD